MRHDITNEETNWRGIMFLFLGFLVTFIILSVVLPDTPIPALHWVCEFVPSARYISGISSYPFFSCTLFSLVWITFPIVTIIYFKWLKISPKSIVLIREKKWFYIYSLGIGAPVIVIGTFFLTGSSNASYSGRIDNLIGESRIFMGFWGALQATIIPFFLVSFFKWIFSIPKIYFIK